MNCDVNKIMMKSARSNIKKDNEVTPVDKLRPGLRAGKMTISCKASLDFLWPMTSLKVIPDFEQTIEDASESDKPESILCVGFELRDVGFRDTDGVGLGSFRAEVACVGLEELSRDLRIEDKVGRVKWPGDVWICPTLRNEECPTLETEFGPFLRVELITDVRLGVGPLNLTEFGVLGECVKVIGGVKGADIFGVRLEGVEGLGSLFRARFPAKLLPGDLRKGSTFC